jgi:cell wall-associated NlpC family hydrolase
VNRLLRCATAGAVLLTGLLLPGASTVAHADPMGDARGEASRLRIEVDRLRHEAEVATEVYDEAYARLGAAVTAHLTAERDLMEAEQSSSSHDELAGRRVRALYMSGGTAGLYAHVLDSASISEVAQRVHQVSVVLSQDGHVARSADQAVALRRDAEKRLSQAAAQSTALQKVVSDKADAVLTLLSRADALLAAADARVLALADQQRRQAAEYSAAQSSAQLQAARAAAGNPPEVLTPRAAAVLAFARSQLGKPYLWGATGPDTYDCSGYTGAAYAAAGVQLPRTSRQQWFAGTQVELGRLQPGDLLFWADDLSDPGTIHHVAIYRGDGMMLAAPHSGDVVKEQPVYLSGYIGAVRPF